MTKLVALIFALLLGLIPTSIEAAAPTLQLAPLQYEAKLQPGKVHQGFIDVSNPADSEVHIVSSVRGFRQRGTDGDLEFFDDPDLSAAITPGLTDFAIGPREAIRVVFMVDATKLPQGGTYAAIFFRTIPSEQSGSASHIAQSANVGTLLLLTNGNSRPVKGEITNLALPFWQFGSGLNGSLSYHNTDESPGGVAVRPKLQLKVFPWSKARLLSTGLVMPGATRKFSLSRDGSYIGPMPVTIRDSDTGRDMTRWVFAVTGWCKLLAIIVIGFCIMLLPTPRTARAWLSRLRRKKSAPQPKKRSVDGIM
jgi:hypothetical protein